MDLIENLMYMHKFQGMTKTLPPGADTLPLAERLRVYLEIFESGCTNTIGDGRPETCPECVRAFVDAVRKAVDRELHPRNL